MRQLLYQVILLRSSQEAMHPLITKGMFSVQHAWRCRAATLLEYRSSIGILPPAEGIDERHSGGQDDIEPPSV